ncbi:uncharacterized protein LOC102807641 [Saccoglossus kowalevskii]|uniref:Uncharacterized protein LOC102807641 n=1 Tax=Saccoglossus kowalevskii TaxID=10224 RepID=A0ABM0M2C0_SACKO|nr:PREDICTED: uncharacterized protein LOC102807641 [Saccoglossus kowalevskii]
MATTSEDRTHTGRVVKIYDIPQELADTAAIPDYLEDSFRGRYKYIPHASGIHAILMFDSRADAATFMKEENKITSQIKRVLCDEVLEGFQANVTSWVSGTLSDEIISSVEKIAAVKVYRKNGQQIVHAATLDELVKVESMLYALLLRSPTNTGNSLERGVDDDVGTSLMSDVVTSSSDYTVDVEDTDDDTRLEVMPPKPSTYRNEEPSSLVGSNQKSPIVHPEALTQPEGRSDIEHSLDLDKCLERLSLAYRTAKGVTVSVYLGDITREDTDVIVNASDSKLRHGGGVAGAISVAGGREIQRESTEYIQQNGELRVGGICHTTGGRLKCRHIIHAVGPVWGRRGHYSRHGIETLYKLLLDVFEYAADVLKAKSISIPAISSGIYGMPLDLCAHTFHRAVEAFSNSDDTGLTEIRIVNIDADAVGAFILEFCGAGSVDLPETEDDVSGAWGGDFAAGFDFDYQSMHSGYDSLTGGMDFVQSGYDGDTGRFIGSFEDALPPSEISSMGLPLDEDHPFKLTDLRDSPDSSNTSTEFKKNDATLDVEKGPLTMPSQECVIGPELQQPSSVMKDEIISTVDEDDSDSDFDF